MSVRLREQCNVCKWWKTDHGLVYFDDVEDFRGHYGVWALGRGDERGFCEFHNDWSDGSYVCNSWEASAPVMNRNGWS